MTLLLVLLVLCVLLLAGCFVTLILFIQGVWNIYNRLIENDVLPPFEESPWREPPQTFG